MCVHYIEWAVVYKVLDPVYIKPLDLCSGFLLAILTCFLV